MVAAASQTASGVGLAATSHSSVIKIVSFVLALAVAYCIYHAWNYAVHRDIPKHKYWVVRLVGYMQTIALQRFFFLVLVVSHQCGWHGLYSSLDGASLDEINRVVLELFDDSFILAILTAFLATEWYLAGEEGMMAAPVRSAPCISKSEKSK